MCGIAGVYRIRGESDDTETVRAMNARLAVRGPDDEGLVRDGPVTLGNRRLAILDLSPAGSQPMWSADRRYVITFNGEVYNYRDLLHEMGLGRRHVRSGTDTEAVLLAWQRWGAGALQRMVGQWAFAIYDTLDRTLWLARDRFGEKPLFYHQTAGVLSFASTIPALLQAPWVPRELDPDALAEYVTLRYVISPRTVLAGVCKLPGGHLLQATPDALEIRRWYDPRFSRHPRPDTRKARKETVERFDELLAQACRRSLVSDVPVALLLSDGIDSNSIRASLREQGTEVSAFTFNPVASPDSGATARQVTEHDASHIDLLATPEQRLQSMVPAFSALTEPIGDGASLATWMLIHKAREHATVFLCGHGGDEVLGGYRLSQDRFRLAAVRRLAFLPPGWTARGLDRFVYGAEPTALKRRRLLERPPRKVPEAARYLIHRPLPVSDLAQLLGAGRPVTHYLRTVDDLYGRCAEDAADLDRMQEVMLATFLTENICSFADSMAMASSAELRMPFLDRDLVEFVLSLPPGFRVSRWPGRANTKLILRWWGRRHLPDAITRRRKRGFAVGSLSRLLAQHGDIVRGRILGAVPLRRTLPGLESWLDHPPEYFHGTWGGTLWALLALAIWSEATGIG